MDRETVFAFSVVFLLLVIGVAFSVVFPAPRPATHDGCKCQYYESKNRMK